jgi:hypothetical protein
MERSKGGDSRRRSTWTSCCFFGAPPDDDDAPQQVTAQTPVHEVQVRAKHTNGAPLESHILACATPERKEEPPAFHTPERERDIEEIAVGYVQEEESHSGSAACDTVIGRPSSLHDGAVVVHAIPQLQLGAMIECDDVLRPSTPPLPPSLPYAPAPLATPRKPREDPGNGSQVTDSMTGDGSRVQTLGQAWIDSESVEQFVEQTIHAISQCILITHWTSSDIACLITLKSAAGSPGQSQLFSIPHITSRDLAEHFMLILLTYTLTCPKMQVWRSIRRGLIWRANLVQKLPRSSVLGPAPCSEEAWRRRSNAPMPNSWTRTCKSGVSRSCERNSRSTMVYCFPTGR